MGDKAIADKETNGYHSLQNSSKVESRLPHYREVAWGPRTQG